MTGFALLLLLCIAIPLAVALVFLALLIYSNRPAVTYRTWVRNARRSWREDGNAMKRVKPRKVDLETILADSTPVQSDPLSETREMVANARTIYGNGKKRGNEQAPSKNGEAGSPHAWDRREDALVVPGAEHDDSLPEGAAKLS